MFPRKSNCKVHRVEPLKETDKLRMGCAASKAGMMVPGVMTGNEPTEGADGSDGGDISTQTTASLDATQYPPAEAFVIPLEDSGDTEQNESLIKKHPPKRLQRLTEVPVTAATIEDLEEKLAKAEVRRQRFLQERVEKIENLGSNGGKSKDDGDEDEGVGDGSGEEGGDGEKKEHCESDKQQDESTDTKEKDGMDDKNDKEMVNGVFEDMTEWKWT